MKVFALLALLTASGLLAAEHQTVSLHDDGEIEHFIQEVPTTEEAIFEIEDQIVHPQFFQFRNPAVIIDRIINTGLRVWKLVEKNRPIVDLGYQYANALPSGVHGPETMLGFSPLQYRSFRRFGKNAFGKVYDITYTLVHRYGGTYHGRGKYLETVAVVPQRVTAIWGYTVNMMVSRISTLNVGDKERPVAGMLLEMRLGVESVFKATQMTSLFEFRGDSSDVTILQ